MLEARTDAVPPRATASAATVRWLDLLGNQMAWWWAVLFARNDLEMVAVIGPVLYLATHLALRSEVRPRVLALGALAALIGWTGDTLLVRAGLLSFPSALETVWSRPWMSGLWAAFAVSLTVSLVWLLRQRLWVAAVLGAPAGPLAYWAGERLGALDLSTWAPLAVAVEWAVAMPLVVLLARALSLAPAAEQGR